MLGLRLGRIFRRIMSSCVYGVLVKLPPVEETLLMAGRIDGVQAGAVSPPAIAAIPLWRRILIMFLRALFFGALGAVTVRLSSPQSETIWTVYESPGDLIRLAVGFAVCLWLVVHFFMFPKRPDIFRFWVYLGLPVSLFALAMAIAVWR
jgi:hypothetical protein